MAATLRNVRYTFIVVPNLQLPFDSDSRQWIAGLFAGTLIG